MKTIQKIFLYGIVSISFLMGSLYMSHAQEIKTTTMSTTEPLPFKKLMNIGNALEAPKDMLWDVTLHDNYFTLIKQAGFDGVRLPVRFSDYAKDQPNAQLDELFMKKLDAHIQFALKEHLYIILDFHHFNELMAEPEKYHDLFLSIWQQLAHRYKDYPAQLVFEVLNEPHQNLSGDLWNTYLAEAVAIIRQENPNRYIVVGGENFNNIDGLEHLTLPKTNHLILTFHYYEPQEFTFQEHPYLGYETYKNVKWLGNNEEKQRIEERLEIVKKWARENEVPVLLGEFGVNEAVPKKMRIAWTTTVRKEAENDGFSWAYWEFGSIFGAYDLKKNQWHDFLLKALLHT
ncbi:MAG: endoglucanase [Firmicutes bacterium]|nr:endoglucanase [Bacillota bacterium]